MKDGNVNFVNASSLLETPKMSELFSSYDHNETWGGANYTLVHIEVFANMFNNVVSELDDPDSFAWEVASDRDAIKKGIETVKDNIMKVDSFTYVNLEG